MRNRFLFLCMTLCFAFALTGCEKPLRDQVKQIATKVKINTDSVDYTKLFAVDEGSGIELILRDASKVDLTKSGTYYITVVLQSDEEVESVQYPVEVFDDGAPVLKAKQDTIVINPGDKIDGADYVSVEDNSGEEIEPVCDLSGVDVNKKGEYVAKYTATDRDGNSSSLDIPVKVIPSYNFEKMSKICQKLGKQKKYKRLSVTADKKFGHIIVEPKEMIGGNKWAIPWRSPERIYRYNVQCVISKENLGCKNAKSSDFKSDLVIYGFNAGGLAKSAPVKKYTLKTKKKTLSFSKKFAKKYEGKVWNWKLFQRGINQNGTAMCFESEKQIDDLRQMASSKKLEVKAKPDSGKEDTRKLTKKERKDIQSVIAFYKEMQEYVFNTVE